MDCTLKECQKTWLERWSGIPSGCVSRPPFSGGITVYFSGTHPTLKVGTWTPYDIDVKKLTHEGLSTANERSKSTGKTRTYHPEDYHLACLLIGWEIWGGFDTDVEFKNLSLRGTERQSKL